MKGLHERICTVHEGMLGITLHTAV
jgi:hypothetical protein